MLTNKYGKSATIYYFLGMRKARQKQLVETKGRKTGRKLTRRIITDNPRGIIQC